MALELVLSQAPFTLAAWLGVAVIAYWLICYAYLWWFHPLSNYPGPPLAAISELWYANAWTSGFWNRKLQHAHKRYGDIIRIAPNELSFATVQAHRDIYGPPSKTRKLFLKSERFYGEEHPNIAFIIDPEEHARQHKMFAPQFRPSAVRTQEPIVHSHVDSWIEQIAIRGNHGTIPLDLTKWLEWLTFDIISELTFGESFHATRDNKSHPWVSILLDATYGGSIVSLQKRLALVRPLLRWMPYISTTARTAIESLAQHSTMTLAKTRKRIDNGPAKISSGSHAVVDDFFVHAIRAGGMSDTELADQAMVILEAGAETSATALTAAIWYLSQPETEHCLARLRTEVRGSFPSPALVTGEATSKLPYLNAVIEETLRLFPPAPVGPPRVSPVGGETIDGTFVQEGVYVSADVWSIHRDERAVGDYPDEFRPERWIGGLKKPYTVPFSAGPRKCIGVTLAWVEMRVALAKLVMAFDWEIAGGISGGTNWIEEARLKQLWKKEPLMMRFCDVGHEGH